MPRPKRHTKPATMKASKRWFPDAKTSSKVSQNTNLRCAKLEEECKSFFRLDEKYTGKSKSPTYVIIDKNALTNLFKNTQCNTFRNASLQVNFERAYGFCETIQVMCNSCADIINEMKTSEQIFNEKNGLNQPYDINLRATQAF
ncbi:uncharacterized protein TNCT_152591 [Trichonephila clavata]|uniref:Uncharacterized protein n=1 Tax=Trichonephila clavata TaxID=2740835 RepID=A0A8X6KU80_TRICU|nr:uncharacterized protein TNCT_152591 [Trichonephila clavata]